MSELRLIRGSDVKLYAGDTPLFGVTGMYAVKKSPFHEVYEYLSASPCDYIPQGEAYEIELSFLSLFDKQLPTDEPFTLQVVDGDSAYCYDNCRVIGQKTTLKGDDHAAEVFTVRADNMRKRRVTE